LRDFPPPAACGKVFAFGGYVDGGSTEGTAFPELWDPNIGR